MAFWPPPNARWSLGPGVRRENEGVGKRRPRSRGGAAVTEWTSAQRVFCWRGIQVLLEAGHAPCSPNEQPTGEYRSGGQAQGGADGVVVGAGHRADAAAHVFKPPIEDVVQGLAEGLAATILLVGEIPQVQGLGQGAEHGLALGDRKSGVEGKAGGGGLT